MTLDTGCSFLGCKILVEIESNDADDANMLLDAFNRYIYREGDSTKFGLFVA